MAEQSDALSRAPSLHRSSRQSRCLLQKQCSLELVVHSMLDDTWQPWLGLQFMHQITVSVS